MAAIAIVQTYDYVKALTSRLLRQEFSVQYFCTSIQIRKVQKSYFNRSSRPPRFDSTFKESIIKHNNIQLASSMENLKTLLVANRGEIATRILKTAKYVLRPYLDNNIDSSGDYIFVPSQSTQR